MIRNYLFLMLTVLIGLSACEVVEPELSKEALTPVLAEGNCQDGEIRQFELTVTEPIGSEGGQYDIEIVTGPYVVTPCMCRVICYQLEVSPETGNGWTVKPQNQASIPFEVETADGYDLLTVTDLAPLMADGWPNGDAILETRYLTTEAVVQSAGGLCIIENYDGTNPPPGTSKNGVVFRQVPADPPATGFVTVAYIPVSMTQ